MTGTKKIITEQKEYRKLEGLNQSMLKRFDEDPIMFYREYILKEPRKEEESWSLGVGQLTDFYLIDCEGNEEEFEQKLSEKFGVFHGSRSTAQAFDLADELFNLTLNCTTEDGEITISFEDRFKEAFLTLQKWEKYKGKTWEQGLEDFKKKRADEYFRQKIANIGKILVDENQIEKAKNISVQALEDEFIGYLLRSHVKEEEIINKPAIEWEYRGINCKAEVDRLIIQHKERVILPIDLKTAYDNEEFEYSYLKRKYYLQNAFYSLAIKQFAVQNGWEDYEILPMSFLVLDTSKNNRRPLLYSTNSKHIEYGLRGFVHNSKYYRGVEELITDILWAQDTGNWTISRINYVNKGIVKLKEFGL